MKEKKNKSEHKDIIERYCTKLGENVILLRSYNDGYYTECINYKTCTYEKDKFCGKEKIENKI